MLQTARSVVIVGIVNELKKNTEQLSSAVVIGIMLILLMRQYWGIGAGIGQNRLTRTNSAKQKGGKV